MRGRGRRLAQGEVGPGAGAGVASPRRAVSAGVTVVACVRTAAVSECGSRSVSRAGTLLARSFSLAEALCSGVGVGSRCPSPAWLQRPRSARSWDEDTERNDECFSRKDGRAEPRVCSPRTCRVGWN